MSEDKNIFDQYQEKNNLRMPGKYKLLWVENAVDVEKKGNNEISTHHTNKFIGTTMKNSAKKIFLLIMIFGLLIILCRVVYLQIFRGSYYQNLSEKNRIRLLPIVAERGIMYDRFHKPLVENIPNFFISIIPQSLPHTAEERTQSIQHIAELSDVNVEDIEKKLKKFGASTYQSLVIKENLDHKTALNLFTQNSDLPGMLIGYGSKRFYYSLTPSSSPKDVKGSSLSHILGYLAKITDQEWEEKKQLDYLPTDNIGRTGLEKTYEQQLRGTYGYKKIEVDASEREQSTLAVVPPIPGKHLVLTIDKEAQQILEHIVVKNTNQLKKQKAVAIAMSPQTGEILAMVSYPFFDNNDFSGGINSTVYQHYINDKTQPLFNRAIGGTYPPGSTLKLVVALAALQEKIISSNTSINSAGGIKVSRWFFPDWKAGGHGITNVVKAIAWSVNTFFYYVGGGYADFKGLGADVLLRYFTLFNLGQKTGIDLPSEASGFVPSKAWKKEQTNEQWFVGDTYNVSIGQGGTTVTPLQVAQWTATVANGGKIMEPHLVHSFIEPVSKQETILAPKNTKQVSVDPINFSIVKQGMKQCVQDGSCKLLQRLPFSSAGKTGTAQWSKNFDPHGWFTSFAPYENPQIVVTVLVEEGKEGASAAMSIAEEFLSWWGKKYLTQ